MGWLTTPTSYLRAQANATSTITAFAMQDGMSIFKEKMPPHSSHPDFGHLCLLVFEAVLEVVFVSLPGYIVARQGMFDAEAQKFVANLNVMVFTPCLIFTKLASQLTAEKLVDLAVIPFIFIVQTLVSYVCAWGISKAFRFKKRPRNFVVAMGVFGNSNSLPISLVLSLSQTIKGLHWDRVPGDNDNEVGARGILYLLIFQQLGQLVRWTWGYNVLLAPPDTYDESEGGTRNRIEDGASEEYSDAEEAGGSDTQVEESTSPSATNSNNTSGHHTPVTHQRYAPSVSSNGSSASSVKRAKPDALLPTPANGNVKPYRDDVLGSPPNHPTAPEEDRITATGWKGYQQRTTRALHRRTHRLTTSISTKSSAAFHTLPTPVQKTLSFIYRSTRRFLLGVWAFMNPPLWAMLVAILVASVPPLQALFFDEGTFVYNSVTHAVTQSGGVAVPLILVVLGANLARNTLPKDQVECEDPKEERNLLIAALVSRMLLPTVIMAPILAVTAKFVPVSILDDPIFIIVCFLLTGAPSALQLAQICQLNGVYMGAMSKLLFQSYVVWILPSTLVLVMLALEVVEWAQDV